MAPPPPLPPLRKPLFPAETASPPTTIAVTGASGYLAGTIIRRLLAAGHTVHGTVRDPANTAKVAHLWAMPGAAERLKLFKADLTDAAAFDAPLAGCTAVIHTASPVIMNPPAGKEREMLLDPAVKGTEAVLSAAGRAGTIKKVVVTSSVAAVFSDAWEKGRDYVFTSADWNEAATETFHPYHRAKTLAERRAWEMAKAEGRGKWALATIVPPMILGPPPGNVKCEVVGLARRLMNGSMYPATAPVGVGVVDVEDCAAAHALAALIPSATGRYIVCGAETTLLGYANQLKPEFGMYKLPIFAMPAWILWLAWRLGVPGAANYPLIALSAPDKVPRFDVGPAASDLGLTSYLPLKATAVDMAASLVDLGIVPRLPGAPSGGGGGGGGGAAAARL